MTKEKDVGGPQSSYKHVTVYTTTGDRIVYNSAGYN